MPYITNGALNLATPHGRRSATASYRMATAANRRPDMLAKAGKFVGWAVWATVKAVITTVAVTVVLWGILYGVAWAFDL